MRQLDNSGLYLVAHSLISLSDWFKHGVRERERERERERQRERDRERERERKREK